MLAKVLRAEQSLLLGRDGGEVHRALRAWLVAGEDARNLQQDAAAGRIVERAVVDVVARHAGHDAEMIVVRAVHDGLVLQLGIGARQHGNDVVGIEGANLADHVSPSAFAGSITA